MHYIGCSFAIVIISMAIVTEGELIANPTIAKFSPPSIQELTVSLISRVPPPPIQPPPFPARHTH